MSGAYDDLFVGTGKSWLEGLTPEARADIDDLADACNVRNAEPIWTRAWARFGERFPNDMPKSPSTFREHVRKVIAERRG